MMMCRLQLCLLHMHNGILVWYLTLIEWVDVFVWLHSVAQSLDIIKSYSSLGNIFIALVYWLVSRQSILLVKIIKPKHDNNVGKCVNIIWDFCVCFIASSYDWFNNSFIIMNNNLMAMSEQSNLNNQLEWIQSTLFNDRQIDII